MDPVVESLILDLLEWIAHSGERPYEEVMDAWRTSCPKLPVWEDANDRGLINTGIANGRAVVRITPAGIDLLGRERPHALRSAKPDCDCTRTPLRQSASSGQV